MRCKIHINCCADFTTFVNKIFLTDDNEAELKFKCLSTSAKYT